MQPQTETHARARKNSNRGAKPGERRGGRQAGTPNKVTRDLKAMILGALEAKGGQAYLEKVADEDPRTFCALLAKVLPMSITGEDGGPLTIHILTAVPRPEMPE